MIHLELCFEEEPGSSESRLFIPTVFDGRDSSGATGSRKWEWKLPPLSGVAPIYFGRRLGCQDVSLTFLTPGFFHRAQVRLRNYLLTDNRVNAVEVDKHLLHFVENGVEVLVEYSGDRDYYVDILVTSSKTFGEAKEFVQKHVVDQLVEFCAGPKGCQGVLLEEFVIKPTCVERLDVLEDRKDKALKVSFLQEKVTEDRGYQCHWKVDDRDMLETDYAIDLLEGPGTYRQQCNDPTPAVQTLAADIAAELPRNLYFKADENWLTSIISKGDYGPVMAIRLYAKCDEGVHVVDSQAGRPLQVRGGHNIQLVKQGVNLARLVVNVAGVVPGGKAVGHGVDSILKNVKKRITPPHEFPISLEKLLSQFVARGEFASTRDVIFALEEYVVTEDIKRWLSRFLDVNGGDIAFRDHFKLWKARRTQDQVVVWVCDECHRRGIRSRTLR